MGTAVRLQRGVENFLSDGNVQFYHCYSFLTIHICQTHQISHVKLVNFIVHKLCYKTDLKIEGKPDFSC